MIKKQTVVNGGVTYTSVHQEIIRANQNVCIFKLLIKKIGMIEITLIQLHEPFQ